MLYRYYIKDFGNTQDNQEILGEKEQTKTWPRARALLKHALVGKERKKRQKQTSYFGTGLIGMQMASKDLEVDTP